MIEECKDMTTLDSHKPSGFKRTLPGLNEFYEKEGEINVCREMWNYLYLLMLFLPFKVRNILFLLNKNLITLFYTTKRKTLLVTTTKS